MYLASQEQMASFFGWGPMKQLVNVEVPENTKPYIFNTSVDHTRCGERSQNKGRSEKDWLRGCCIPFPGCVRACVHACVCVGREFWSLKFDHFQQL